MSQDLSRTTTALLRRSLLAAALCVSQTLWASSLTFGLFGDVYMTPEHQGYLKGMLADMAAKGSDLAISTGGLKPADQSCKDTNLLAAYPVFAAAPLPTFYVPGDAEWLLCGKSATGNFSPEERLNLLRKTFYQSDRSLGQPSLPLIRQPDYPEHMRWQTGPALFITLSSPNNISVDRKDLAGTESLDNRTSAVEAWIKEAFSEARKQDISMLVMVMPHQVVFDTPEADSKTPPEKQLLANLIRSETFGFPGQVLMVHGGNGVHRIDHPLLNPDNQLPIQNFTRVETYGALQQGWVQVKIERNKKSGDDPVHRTEFLFQSYPWPPLDMKADEEEPQTSN
ncbi:MAG: hypothetical protein ACKODT_04985 [Fluviibacter sp.]